MASLIDYSQDFSTKKMMQDIEEKIKAYINKEEKPSEPRGMLERAPSPDKLDGDSIVVSSLENMMKQASENKATRFRGMDFTAERPKSSPEEINKFLSSIEGYPMNFSGSIIKERDILESDIMKDVRADAAEKLIEEAPVVDIAKAIEQDQGRQQDTSTLKGGKVGLMAKPVKNPTQQLLDRIAFGEGADPKKLQRQAKHNIGTTEYDMVYNYGDTVKPSKPITEMKLSELADYQRKLINATKGTLLKTKYGTSAVGKYQVVYNSLFGKGGTPQSPAKNSWADKLNLKADTIYSPKVQEDIGRLALRETGYDNWLAGKKSEADMLKRVADIWASVEGSTANQGTHTSIKDLEPFLSQVRP